MWVFFYYLGDGLEGRACVLDDVGDGDGDLVGALSMAGRAPRFYEAASPDSGRICESNHDRIPECDLQALQERIGPPLG